MKRRIRQKSVPAYSTKIKDSMLLYSSSGLVSVAPNEQFIQWVKSFRPGEFGFRDIELRSYLVPDCDNLDACEQWVLANAQQILEEEFREYDPSGRHWPPVRNADTVFDFFGFVYHSRVIHLRRNNILN